MGHEGHESHEQHTFTSPCPAASKEEGGVRLRRNPPFLYYCRAAADPKDQNSLSRGAKAAGRENLIAMLETKRQSNRKQDANRGPIYYVIPCALQSS